MADQNQPITGKIDSWLDRTSSGDLAPVYAELGALDPEYTGMAGIDNIKEIQRDSRCCNVTTSVRSSQADSEPLSFGVEHSTKECLDALNLYQRYFASAKTRFLRVKTCACEIPIPL